jgi:hypothetical protein
VKKDAIVKAAVTKKMNQLAGARLPLPGHNHHREAALRAELTASFQPQGTAEMLWVHDIAYCTAVMEWIAAQIAALQRHHVARACTHALAERQPDPVPQLSIEAPYSQQDRAYFGALADGDFTASYNNTLLDDRMLAVLLGSVNKEEAGLSRMLQQSLHDERKERDRIINQLERRRRNAMRDAIERAEEARRALAFSTLCAERAAIAAADVPRRKLIAGVAADRVEMEDDAAGQGIDMQVIEAPTVGDVL